MEETAGYKEEKDSWETSYWPENNEMTNTLSLSVYFPLACHSPMNGISHEHRPDFNCATLYTVQWRTTVIARAKTHQQSVSQNRKVPVSYRGRRWKAEKTHLRNGSTCVMLVNNDNTVEVAGEESQKQISYLHRYKRTLQQSRCQKNVKLDTCITF